MTATATSLWTDYKADKAFDEMINQQGYARPLCSTLGQYLQPTRNHHPVIDWIHPDQFSSLKQIGLDKGFRYVESGPLVRSSYHAEKHIFKI